MLEGMRVSGVFRTVASASVVTLLSLLPAYSQQITLRVTDGGMEITGELVGFDDQVYTIDSTLGRLNVRADSVECISVVCPQVGTGAGVAAIQGPVVWDVSLWGSRRAFTEHVEKLAELVNEKTGGQLTLNLDYGGLAPSEENLDGIAAGLFEMAQFCAGYHPEKTPSITILELPFLGVSSIEQERILSEAVYAHPAVEADLARWNATLLMPSPQPQYNILGVGTPPTSLAAFQNMTVRATGGSGEAIEALGATTINIPAPQVRQALTDGTINAVAFAPHAHLSFDTIESGTWWTTNLNPGTANCPIVVNSDALAALPAASRVALLSSVNEALDHFIDNYNSTTMDAWEQALQERNIIQITITEDIISAIDREVAGPVAANWIERTNALGLPGQEIYDLVADVLSRERS